MADFSKFQFQGEDGRDEFQREPIAEKIIQLLTSEIDISPMIIDGDWGTGKSEFCHKLINKFKKDKEDYQVIYIDAFKADHADNPLMTIFAGIIKLVPPDEKASFIKKALPVMRYGTKAILKAGVSHIMKKNADDIADELEGVIQDVANSAIDATITALLKDHEEAEKNLEALQTLLEKLAKDKPIIIFIDELDRCRPDFSVSMLEVIKHTFNVENVKFVLVTNTVQLKAAINHAYGSTIDAQRYLDKFIKFTMALPTKFGHEYALKISSIEYFNKLIMVKSEFQNTFLVNTRDDDSRLALVYRLIGENKLSLREVETFVRYFEIAKVFGFQLDRKSRWGFGILYVLGIFIACFRPKLVQDIQNKNVDAEDLFEIVNISYDDELSLYGSNLGLILLASQACYNSSIAQELVKKFQEHYGRTLESAFFDGSLHSSTPYWDLVLNVIDVIHLRTK